MRDPQKSARYWATRGWSVNKPARGDPASGPGWAGPAKGAGAGRPARPFTPELAKQAAKTRAALKENPVMAEERKRLAAEKEARLEQMMEVWGDIALNETGYPMARVTAAEKIYDRIDGKPAQTNKNENRDMTLEKMVADASKLRERRPD